MKHVSRLFFPAATRSLSYVAPYPWILSLYMDDELHPFDDYVRSSAPCICLIAANSVSGLNNDNAIIDG